MTAANDNANSATLINADFSRRAVVRSADTPWIPSPSPGVERRPLDRIGDEVARATSLVRYAPHSDFAPHVHDMGEEYLVLEGEFGDEHGAYPVGAYVRNPPGSRHSPRVGPGCVIFVKLRQMPSSETERVVIDTAAAHWPEADAHGRARLSLYAAPDGESVALERLGPGGDAPEERLAGGEEILVLSGALHDGEDLLAAGDWARSPAGRVRRLSSESGALYWVKRGHLDQQ